MATETHITKPARRPCAYGVAVDRHDQVETRRLELGIVYREMGELSEPLSVMFFEDVNELLLIEIQLAKTSAGIKFAAACEAVMTAYSDQSPADDTFEWFLAHRMTENLSDIKKMMTRQTPLAQRKQSAQRLFERGLLPEDEYRKVVPK